MRPFSVRSPRPSGNFTQVPNEVLFSPALTDQQKIVWMTLCSICHNGESETYRSIGELADQLDLPVRNLQRSIKTLQNLGFIARNAKGDNYELLVESVGPEQVTEVKEAKLSKNQQLRHDLTETWNTKKPENFPAMRGPFQGARLEVLQSHAEMVGCSDLRSYLGRVLLACKMNDWYKRVPQTFENIFGSGNPTTKKLEKTQKMYHEAQGKKAEAADFDRDNDQSWLDWFASKGHEFARVERLTMERFTAWKHETDEGSKDTLYVYCDESDDLVHWTYKEHQSGVSYLPTAN